MAHGWKLRLRHSCEYAVFRALLFVVQCLPAQVAFAMADLLAWLICRLPPRWNRYGTAAANLRTAFGEDLPEAEIRRLFCGMWRHLFRMVCEMVQMPKRFSLAACTEVLTFEGREQCVRAILADRPVLFLGGHFGNWEISVATFGHFGFPSAVVARDLDNPWLQNWFRRFRESTGNQLVSKAGAGAEVSEILRQGGMASLLCDQDAGRSGVFVDFFGRPASTFKSIALLALQYDALVVVGGAWRLPTEQQRGAQWVRFCLTTEAVLDPRNYPDTNAVEQLTQDFTTALERLIRKAPEQYFWVHRRWKTAPGARRRKVA